MNAVVVGSTQRSGNTSSTLSATNTSAAITRTFGQRRFRDLLFRLRAMTAGILA
jgi:hypothetical protein